MKTILGAFFVAAVIIAAFWTGYFMKTASNWERLQDSYEKGRLSGLDDGVAIKCNGTRG